MPARDRRVSSASCLTLSLVLAAVAGCASAPPELQTAAAPAAAWRQGPTTDTPLQAHWWLAFGDPVLDELENGLTTQTPSLAAGVARFDQAVAIARRARADRLPELGLDAGASRSRDIDGDEATATSLEAVFSYSPDLWGRLRALAAAGATDAHVAAADLAGLELDLRTQLAARYFDIRRLDAILALQRGTAQIYVQALDLTQVRLNEGLSSARDVAQAQTQLASLQAEIAETEAERAQMETAVAVLIGENPSTFELTAATDLSEPPIIPAQAPAGLVRRRPDIAAAEQRLVSAGYRLDAARTSALPDILLSASGGAAGLGDAVLGAGVWSLGPISATLPLLDFGRRRADTDRALAIRDEASADHRAAVLQAYREVEDQLALTTRLAVSDERRSAAGEAAAESLRLADLLYREGADDYLDVVVAQTAALDARQAELEIRGRRLTAAIDLIRALGGGWAGLDAPG